jgi:hypothetical protein
VSDERDLHRRQALDAFWDEFGGDDPGRPSDLDLDPILAEAIRRLHDLDTQPAEDPAFGPRLWADMMGGVAQAGTLPLRPRPLGTNGRTQLPPRPGVSATQPAPWRHRSTVVAAIAAVLLLIGVGIGYLAFGPGWPGDELRTTIPAAVAPAATPSPAPYTEESLLTITLPAEALPGGDAIGAGLIHVTIPVGNRSTWVPTCCPGPYVDYVIVGSYTVRADAPIQVVRDDGSAEDIPAGTEVTLGAGDALISRNEVGIEGANTGSGPVELLGWLLVETTSSFGGHYLPGWVSYSSDVQLPLLLSPSPATLHVRRIELTGEASFPAPADGTLVFVVSPPVNAAGTPTTVSRVVKRSDGELVNVGKETGVVYLVTLEQVAPPDGSPISGTPTP